MVADEAGSTGAEVHDRGLFSSNLPPKIPQNRWPTPKKIPPIESSWLIGLRNREFEGLQCLDRASGDRVQEPNHPERGIRTPLHTQGLP